MTKDNKRYKILVIEDNDGDFTIVEEFLMEQISDPFIVHADNFKKASNELRSRETFDIVLLDLTLPDKSGQKLIVEILQIASFCPIIVLTGFANIDFSIESISLGISDYLVKDELTAVSLYKSIIYALERKRSISELEQSQKRYSDLFHLSPMPMWIHDMETLRFLQINKAGIAHYDYTEDEFLNMTVPDLLPKGEQEKVMNAINIAKHEGINLVRINHAKRSGELIDVEISTTEVVINERKCKFVIVNDVTEKNLFEIKLTKAIIKTQEDERYEIGGELHDNVCQILATSMLSLGMIKTSLLPGGEQWFVQCRDYINLATEEIRNLSHRLAPAFFDDTTLEGAIERLLRSFNIENKYTVSLGFDDSLKKYPISQELQLNLYRIMQEQLRNILKYAKATSISVDLALSNGNLKMRIVDNGMGFTLKKESGGIGFSNMRRRAALFFGKMDIETSVGYGCKLIIDIPLEHHNT